MTSSTRLRVKVVPGSPRDAIDGWLGDTLKVRVTAPPERGKANSAVLRLLAEAIGIPVAQARLVSGHASTRKVVELTGVTDAQVADRVSRR